jgi:hypothetical protein
MGEEHEKRNKSFTRERDCVCEQRRLLQRTMMTTMTMTTTATATRTHTRWLVSHGCKTSTVLVMLVLVTATMQLAYLNKSPLLVVPIVVTTNSTRTQQSLPMGQTSSAPPKTALRVVPSSTRSTASEKQDVALDDSPTDAVSTSTTTTSRENNDNLEAAVVAANRASELSSSTAAPTESDLPLSPTLTTTDYVVTNLNEASDYVHYQQLSDFLEGPGVEDDNDNRDALAAICEFRPVPWSHHFPHA